MLGTPALGRQENCCKLMAKLGLHSETLSQSRSVGGGTENHSKIVRAEICFYFNFECVFLPRANVDQYR